jgi:hypothetical protein
MFKSAGGEVVIRLFIPDWFFAGHPTPLDISLYLKYLDIKVMF